MPVQKKESRLQINFTCLEDFIAQDNPVRVIDAFVDYLDLKDLEFLERGTSHQGKPAYEADTLLKLYLYSYLNRTRSSRSIERSCRINIELQWLIHGQKPSYKTISDFRKDNPKGLENTFKAFVSFLKGESLLEDDLVAIDSSRFSGQNSKGKNYNKQKLEDNLNHNEEQAKKYLNELDKADNEQADSVLSKKEIEAKLELLAQRNIKNRVLLEKLDESEDTQISTVDSDARRLSKKGSDSIVGYNNQIATSDTNKIITNYKVTNKKDTNALFGIAKEAKEVLSVEKLSVLADKGYDNGEEIALCTEEDIETYVSTRAPSYRKGSNKDYRKDKFKYNEEEDYYICPEEKILNTNGKVYKMNRKGKKSTNYVEYKLKFKGGCNDCPKKTKCLSKTDVKIGRGKSIKRFKYSEYREANQKRVEQNMALYKKRKSLVEHPFGTIKRSWGYSYTLLRGMDKVSGEFGIIFTCYNLRRAMSIFGVKDLLIRINIVFCVIIESLALIKGDTHHYSTINI